MTPTTKIAAGLYEFTFAGRNFQVENSQAFSADALPGWIVFEIHPRSGAREYLNDYWTKRDAIENTIKALRADAA